MIVVVQDAHSLSPCSVDYIIIAKCLKNVLQVGYRTSSLALSVYTLPT